MNELVYEQDAARRQREKMKNKFAATVSMSRLRFWVRSGQISGQTIYVKKR